MSLNVSEERLLAEALADAMERDLADIPEEEQLKDQHHFSKKFERNIRRLERAANTVADAQTSQNPGKSTDVHNQKTVDFRSHGAAAKRYGSLAAAFVCVIGLVTVAGIMSGSFRSKSAVDESIAESAADTAAPEFAAGDAMEDAAIDDSTEEAVTEDADDAAEEFAVEDMPDEAPEDEKAAASGGGADRVDVNENASGGMTDNGSPEESKGASSQGEVSEDSETPAPDWQEQLLIESEKADELVTWHFQIMYDDGSIGLTSEVVNPSHSTGAAPGQSLYVSGVFEVYYEQSPNEWECVYRTKRTRDNYTAATGWDEWYALEELHMTQAGTYRLVRQVNSYRQVLQLTLEER